MYLKFKSNYRIKEIYNYFVFNAAMDSIQCIVNCNWALLFHFVLFEHQTFMRKINSFPYYYIILLFMYFQYLVRRQL